MKQNGVTVSVIMITYNHEKYIKQAVESVLMQKCNFEIELIVANDCSPDNTCEVINKVINSHINGAWVKYTRHSKNIGMNSNFNWAFNEASGKYIGICEGDDYWTDPLKLQKQVDVLESNSEYSMCVHNTKILNGKNIQLTDWRLNTKRKIYSIEDYIYELFFHTSSVLFRNLNLPKYVTSHEILQQDIAIFLLAINNNKIYFIEDSMSLYRKHINGITNDDFYKSKFNTYKSLLFIYEKFDEYTKNKFKTIIWLKRQIIKSLIYINCDKKISFTKVFAKVYYYFFKAILKLWIKLF